MASIAINGLGRVGRAAIKIIEDAGGADVVAVNNLIPPDNLAYLLRYDTVYGRYHKTVTATGDSLAIGGRAGGRCRCSPAGTPPGCRGGISAWTWCSNARAPSAGRRT
jgi:hypothetical protein